MKKILIVDDQKEICRLIQVVLNRDDRIFLQATNGEDGVSTARKERPDLILMDLMMPGRMDGFDAIRAIREDPDLGRSPIIAMTARMMDQNDHATTQDCGAQACLRKPFVISELQRLVDSFLQ